LELVQQEKLGLLVRLERLDPLEILGHLVIKELLVGLVLLGQAEQLELQALRARQEKLEKLVLLVLQEQRVLRDRLEILVLLVILARKDLKEILANQVLLVKQE
jgi:hypothetical protein